MRYSAFFSCQNSPVFWGEGSCYCGRREPDDVYMTSVLCLREARGQTYCEGEHLRFGHSTEGAGTTVGRFWAVLSRA